MAAKDHCKEPILASVMVQVLSMLEAMFLLALIPSQYIIPPSHRAAPGARF
jgi:hypothetical protein